MKQKLLLSIALLCAVAQGAWSENVVDLSTLTSEYVAQDGDVLTGTIDNKAVMISIAPGASVTLRNAAIIGSAEYYTTAEGTGQGPSKTIYHYEHPNPGISCVGNATIILEGNNQICGHSPYYPGIMPGPKGTTLTIKGDGGLYAYSHGCAPGIGTPRCGLFDNPEGSGYKLGHLIIEGGNITAFGGDGMEKLDEEYGSPGIGCDRKCSLDGITLKGGTIRAYGKRGSAGIGECGTTTYNCSETDCGPITIDGSTVYAYGGERGAGIGTGALIYLPNRWSHDYGCTINILTGSIEAYGGSDAAGIGGGYNCYGGTITIEGGTIKAKGGAEAAGIGGGEDGTGGDIRIYGGDITAYGGDYAAGIGGGDGERGGAIWITGGTIKAYGGKDGAGIGGGESGDSGSIVINGGDVYASGDGYGVGIGAGEDGDVDNTISINGGTVDAYGGFDIRRAIGGEDDEDYSSISIGDNVKVTDVSSGSALYYSYKIIRSAYKDYMHLKFEPCDHAGQTLSYVYVDDSKHKFACQWCGWKEEEHTGQYSCTKCTYNEKPHYVNYYEMVYNEGSQKYEYKLVASETFKNSLVLPAHHGTVPADRVFARWTGVELDANDDGIVKEDSYHLWPAGQYISTDASVLNIKARYVNKTLDLATVQSDQTVYDGVVVTGTLDTENHPVKITIANNATVTLSGATINGVNNENYNWAGITCEGNATIILADGTTNIVKGFHSYYPGVFVPASSILTIDGEGSLNASSNGFGAGIGGGYYGAPCGVININGGNITATGGRYAAGIGSSHNNSCSHIIISGGTIHATGGDSAAGIGSGWGGTNQGDFSSCGLISITNGVTSVTATKGSEDAPNSIGAGDHGTCLSSGVAIGNMVGVVTRSPYNYVPLVDEADNSTKIAAFDNQFCGVTLKDRTLYRDGAWNTLCLPFEVTLEGSPLEGAEARTLSSASLSDDILTLNFSEPVTTLAAGTPYIIKWDEEAADFVIRSQSDWNTFAQNVNIGNTYSGKIVGLAADITVSTMVGLTLPFKGTFNGNGHTLTFTYIGSEEYIAPFRHVEDATISNLHTTGTITTSRKFSSGLVAYARGTNAINNCWSSVEIISSVDGDGTHGGLVAYTEENNSYTTLNNCLFDGSIIGAKTHSCGGLVGWSYVMTTLNNCVCRPQSIKLDSSNNATFSRGNNVTANNCYYSENLPGASGQGTAIGTMSNDDLVDALGDGWKIKDGKVIPGIMKYEYSSIEIPTFTNVTITATTPTDITPTETGSDGSVTFKGTFDPVTIDEDGDNTKLYLGSGNKLYWPSKAMSINAFRAYFQLNSDQASNARAFVLNFDGGEQTGITTTDFKDFTNSADVWYDLSGRQLSGKPTKKGVYIHRGKKQVVK
jgi:hypothetical protein